MYVCMYTDATAMSIGAHMMTYRYVSTAAGSASTRHTQSVVGLVVLKMLLHMSTRGYSKNTEHRPHVAILIHSCLTNQMRPHPMEP